MSQAQSRFSRFAQRYVTSPTHAGGPDLERLLKLAQPQPEWWILDVATGGGHTALAFAPQVARVVASDFAQAMLLAARDFIDGLETSNLDYVNNDAERLAFTSGTFDLVTCRIAPHHFLDCFRFVQECTRVLKPGGLLLIEDHVMPDGEQAAHYLNTFQRLRDPSHVRAYANYEWEGMFLDAGLTVAHTEHFARSTRLLPWATRQSCTPYTIERLQLMLIQAPAAARDWLQPQCAGTDDAAFDQHYILIMGRKPE
ncbi:MAG: class I SAM-dependent methyltransferase [Anaerolineae bacterium]|nr:class I SAM-dependent methyltransferase [Anaerolineae bacterium]